MGCRAVPLVPIDTMVNTTEKIQVASVSQWHTTHGSRSNEAPVMSQTQKSLDLRTSSRMDLAS
jgi:hypothetical protein